MSESRSNTIYVVVGRPDHHCVDDLVQTVDRRPSCDFIWQTIPHISNSPAEKVRSCLRSASVSKQFEPVTSQHNVITAEECILEERYVTAEFIFLN